MPFQARFLTEAQLLARIDAALLVMLTDDTNTPPESIDYAVLNEVVAEAEDVLVSHLQGRYAGYLERDQSTPLLRRLIISLAHFHLHQRRGQVPADVNAAAERAYRDLTDLREGRTLVPGWVSSGGPAATTFTFPAPQSLHAPWASGQADEEL
jgi:phage gp36-like protein